MRGSRREGNSARAQGSCSSHREMEREMRWRAARARQSWKVRMAQLRPQLQLRAQWTVQVGEEMGGREGGVKGMREVDGRVE